MRVPVSVPGGVARPDDPSLRFACCSDGPQAESRTRTRSFVRAESVSRIWQWLVEPRLKRQPVTSGDAVLGRFGTPIAQVDRVCVDLTQDRTYAVLSMNASNVSDDRLIMVPEETLSLAEQENHWELDLGTERQLHERERRPVLVLVE